jgi:hypothetical protein
LVKPEVKAKPSEKGFHCVPQKRSRLYAYANLLCPMFESELVLWWLGCNWLLYCWLCGYVICELATRFSICMQIILRAE